MQITDIHAHVFPDPIAGKASGSIGAFYQMPVRLEGTVGQLLEKEQEAGIGHACIHSVALTPHYVDSINRFIADTVKQHSDRLTGFGAIHPDCEDIPGLIREIKGMGLKGLKIHPDMQRFALDSPAAMEMFAAIEGELPIVIHTGDPRFEYSNPRRMKKVLDAFPKLVCVCAHLGGWSEWDDASKMLTGYENVYVDTSSSLYAMTPEKAREMIRHYSRERVMFGTDYPMWVQQPDLAFMEQLGLTDAEYERIWWKNCAQLYGMDVQT